MLLNRRAFLAAIAAAPLVQRLLGNAVPTIPIDRTPQWEFPTELPPVDGMSIPVVITDIASDANYTRFQGRFPANCLEGMAVVLVVVNGVLVPEKFDSDFSHAIFEPDSVTVRVPNSVAFCSPLPFCYLLVVPSEAYTL